MMVAEAREKLAQVVETLGVYATLSALADIVLLNAGKDAERSKIAKRVAESIRRARDSV